MIVQTQSGAWVVPPGLALWMPGGMEHEVHAVTALGMRTIYIRPDAAPCLPATCRVVGVTPLLRDLILHSVRIPPAPTNDNPSGRLMRVPLTQDRDLPGAPPNPPRARE